MGRLLTVMVVMILGSMAVRTQEPNPYITNGRVNGVAWRTASNDMKVFYVNGAMSGYIRGAYYLATPLPDDCTRRVKAAMPAWFRYMAPPGDAVKEMDSFYEDGANISIPTIDAFVYSYMKLSGATKAELDQYRAVALKIAASK